LSTENLRDSSTARTPAIQWAAKQVAVAKTEKGGIGTMQEVEPGGVPTIDGVNYKIK
jgi:hypothetical protein